MESSLRHKVFTNQLIIWRTQMVPKIKQMKKIALAVIFAAAKITICLSQMAGTPYITLSQQVNVEVLAVGGGGGGGGYDVISGAGGASGGVVRASFYIYNGNSFTVSVGGG